MSNCKKKENLVKLQAYMKREHEVTKNVKNRYSKKQSK